MAQLAKHADQLDQQYQTYFAGHPRFSRDPSLLRRMAEQAKKHLEIGVAQDNDTEARTRLRKQVELFESEARSIDAIQAAASEEFLGHEYRSWVDLIFARYRRNFAAQSRSDRPLHLLKGLNTEVARVIEQLEKLEIRGANEVVTEALKTAHQNQTLFADEIGAIAELRTEGDVSQRTSLLANDAYRLFEVWGHYFSNKARLSRRIDRLTQMMVHLEWIADQMTDVERVGEEGLNAKNREICAQRLSFYKKEREQIQLARGQASFDQIVLALGEAANQAFDDYRAEFAGRDRKTVQLDTLNRICEELFDLAVQMNELDLVRSHDANQQNLATVLDQLRLFQREYDTIRQVQEAS